MDKCSSISSTDRTFLILRNTKSSIFGGSSMFLELIVFGQILANFGTFGHIWIEFLALAMAKSIHEARLKSQKTSISSTMNPNTWNTSLKSYHLYLMPQNFL
jgi:hypothetical protein